MDNPYATPASPIPEETELSRKHRRDAAILRVCVFLKIPMIAAIIVVGRMFEIKQPEAAPSVTLQTPIFWFAVVLLLAIVTSWVGLLFLRRWAGWLFTASYIVMILSDQYFSGAENRHSYVIGVEYVNHMLSAAIVIMAFFSYAIKPNNVAEQDVAPDG